MPAGTKFQEIKQPALKDEFDEWIARLVCFAFSTSPTPFVKAQNRATAETQEQAAQEGGLAPVMAWVKRLLDRVLAEDFGRGDLEFAWSEDREFDPLAAARIDDLALRNGSKLLNEVRDRLGLDPVPGGDVPMVLTPSGYVRIGETLPALGKAEDWNPELHPRVPAGSPQGGQFTNGDGGGDGETGATVAQDEPATPTAVHDDSASEPKIAPSNDPAGGSGQGTPPSDAQTNPPPEDLPQIPPTKPDNKKELNRLIRAVANLLLKALKRGVPSEVKLLINIIEASVWLYEYYPIIKSYSDPPKPLDELKKLVSSPARGYEIHHIVEQTSAAKDKFPRSQIDDPDNLVRIPTLKHREISAWYATANDEYGGLTPRQYLVGKSWEQRREFGLMVLRKFGVLEP